MFWDFAEVPRETEEFKELEWVQEAATCLAGGLLVPSYEERVKITGVLSMAYCYARRDIDCIQRVVRRYLGTKLKAGTPPNQWAKPTPKSGI